MLIKKGFIMYYLLRMYIIMNSNFYTPPVSLALQHKILIKKEVPYFYTLCLDKYPLRSR